MNSGGSLSQLNAFFRPHGGAQLDSSNFEDDGSDTSGAAQSSAASSPQSAPNLMSLHVDLSGSSSHTAAQPRQTNSQTIVGAAGGMRFDLIWDNSVANAPSAYKSAIEAAAKFYTQIFSNDQVIKVHVGWGEVDGQSLGANALGENIANQVSESYTSVYNSLWNDSGSSSVQSGADQTLPGSNPLPTSSFSVTIAQAQAWGLLNGNSGANDGWMGLANTNQLGASWDFSPTSQPGPNQYDAVTTAEHELSEMMGRYSNVDHGDGYGKYSALDLFRYSAPGVRDLHSNNGKAYFSIDNGVTNLGVYNNNYSYGDLGDWTGSVQNDSFGSGYNGEKSPVSTNDIIEEAILGYNLTAYGKTLI